MKRSFILLSLVATMVPLGVAQTRTDLPVALRKALESGPSLKYSGKRRVEFRRDGKTQAFTEVMIRDGSRLRIEFPAGSTYAGQVIVENRGRRMHFFPDKNEIHVAPARREEAFERLLKLSRTKKYKFSVGAEETIAGISADQIVVSDDNGNIAQRLFIDPRTGMLLKRKLFDAVGTQVGFFEFQSVDLDPKLNSGMFQLARKGAKILEPIDLMKRVAAADGFAIAYVKRSSGYDLAFSKTNIIDGKDVLVQFYSSKDGRLSLFQTKADVSREQLDRFSRGDLNAYAWKVRSKTFVLIGSQSETVLKKLASQISYK